MKPSCTQNDEKRGGYRRGAGRKKATPPGARDRTFRVTDEERAEIVELLKLRRRKK